MPRTAREAINSYVTDMLGLEHHIQKALRGQIEDIDEDHPDIASQLQGIVGTVDTHIASLKALADRREGAGQGVADAIKRAGSAVLGVGAAAVDFVRSEKLPKDLRDDFTAMNMANIGYLMLYTTALSLDDREVAELAQRHLKDHTQCTVTLQNLIPDAVVRFLQEDGLPARRDVLSEVSRSLESFRGGAGGVPIADDTVSSRRTGTMGTGIESGGLADRGRPDAGGRL